MATVDIRPVETVIHRLEQRGFAPQPAGNGNWRARCPVHLGKSKNLSIREESGGTVLLHCHHVEAGQTTCSAAAIAEAIGMRFRDLFPGKPADVAKAKRPCKERLPEEPREPKKTKAYPSPSAAIGGIVKHLGQPTAYWVYEEVVGGQKFELMRVFRFDLPDETKQFRPVHVQADGWHLGDPPGPLPLYHLPELVGAKLVVVAEGEKCADILRNLGLVATTSSHGSNAPAKTDWSPLSGSDRTVIIIPDRDEPGAAYAQAVAKILHHLPKRPDIRILDLPGGQKGDDIEQWLDRVPDWWSDEDCRHELTKLWRGVSQWEPPPPNTPPETPQPKGRPDYNLTEVGNARRLVHNYGDRLRYCYDRGQWLVWSGKRWEPDHKGTIWAWAKEMVREILFEAANQFDKEQKLKTINWAMASEKKKVIAASIDLAWSEPGMSIAATELDRDPWLLNCPNGTVDLRTGELRAHSAKEMLSKSTLCNYDPAAEPVRFLKALNLIFQGDQELIGFVRRALGYSLTGDTSAQVMFLCYGSGRNGKNMLLDAVRDILHDYASVASPRVLLTSGQNDHPAMLADLLGCRFVPTSEVDDGERLAEALLKRLTGDATIKARFMHQNPFEFAVTWKLWMLANARPEIHGTDPGIWSRIKVIPFDVFIPPEKRIPNLSKILVRDEGPQILGWMVKGCVEWQSVGLMEPAKVLDATLSYREEQDSIRDFISECCHDHKNHPVLVDQAMVKAPDLYKRYVDWSLASGDKQFMARRRFANEITKRGYRRKESNGSTFVLGLTLIQASQQDDDDFQPKGSAF